jgi:integrase
MADEMAFTTTRPPRRRYLNDEGVARLRPRPKRYTHADPELIGHYVRVLPTGVKSFLTVARDPFGKQVWTTIGRCDRIKIEASREKAREIIRRVKAGKPAFEPEPPKADTLAAVVADWLALYVGPKGLRTRPEIKRRLNKYVLPILGDRPFVELKRSDIAKLLDGIQHKHGARQADTCLTDLRSVANWYASRSDYVPIFTRGMKRSDAKPRDRILNHDEIRTIWEAASAEDVGPFGGIVRLCLLTAQRKQKVAAMRHDDILDDVWRIPQAPREKDAGGDLVLPKLALNVIAEQPRHAVNRHVFPAKWGPGHVHVGLDTMKKNFDARLPAGFEPWVVHDLRRTSRSLMSEAGVDRNVAERVLGHKVGGGVERTYDRFAYIREKGAALAKLAEHIKIILSGPVDNVVPYRPASSS